MERKYDGNELNKDKPANDKNAAKPQAGHVDSAKPNAAGGKSGEKISTEVQTDRLVNEGGPSRPSDSQPKAPAKSPASANVQNPAESQGNSKPSGRDTRDAKDGNAQPMKKPKSNSAES